MNFKDKEFQKRLFETFKAEAGEHLGTIASGLVELEKGPSPEVQFQIVEAIFRNAHSLKGASRAVNIPDIESVCQAVESIFASWKNRGVTRAREVFDLLFKAVEEMRSALRAVEAGEKPDASNIKTLVRRLNLADIPGAASETLPHSPTPRQKSETVHPSPESGPEKRFVRDYSQTDTIRVSTAKLNSILINAEEMIGSKLASNLNAESLSEISSLLAQLKNRLPLAQGKSQKSSASAESDTDFYVWARGHIKKIESRIQAADKSLKQFNRTLNRSVDNLLEGVKTAMLQPFSFMLDAFPVLAREIAGAQRKEVELVISGSEIEIDRRILDELKDPVNHIVRNCIDHGIERPEARLAARKSVKGTISMSVAHLDGNRVELAIKDDGAGINVASVKEAAVKGGIITGSEADSMGESEALSLVFHSGVSTSPMITEISGRGLGLAIAREKIDRLGGSIAIESRPGSGTCFRIILPLTMATFKGLLVRASGQALVFPSRSVEKTIRLANTEIRTVENRETVPFNGRPVSFAWLSDLLGMPSSRRDERLVSPMVVVKDAERRIAFGVDAVLEEEEVLVKGLSRQLSRVRNISGAAILGTGKPVPILNVQDLMLQAAKSAASPQTQKAVEPQEKRSILVAEDSITSRILLKNILEASGYSVTTCVDGIDAITTLKSGAYDLVISDIEMPRMDGFDLTARIRSDEKFAELPVVLVTGLESREDKERGIDVGANAYIVKSSFDQSNLLEIIRRLI